MAKHPLPPALLTEWADERDPAEFFTNTRIKVLWRCSVCGSEWMAEPRRRAEGSGCHECGKVARAKARALASVKKHPIEGLLLKEWADERDPATVSAMSNGTAKWKCSECAHEWEATVANRYRGAGCLKCSQKRGPGLQRATAAMGNPVPAELLTEWADERDPAEFSAGTGTKVEWRCAEGHEWSAAVKERVRGRGCPQCNANSFVSKGENEIAEFVIGLMGEDEVRTSVRDVIKGEIDIYIPSRNIGIEFNGMYWHSEAAGKGRYYHRDKYDSCAENGIQLISIWENDWRDRQDVCKSMIAHKLGVSDAEKVNARSCEVREVDGTERKSFLNANHIQGNASTSRAYGLYHDDALVALICMKWAGKNRPGELLLTRYATSMIVRGGFQKLLKHAVREMRPQTVFTFADHGVSDGGLYRSSGFELDCVLPPDYRYFYRGNLVHKFSFRRKRFRDDPLLEWDESWTEREAAKHNNIHRVWDSGKDRYSLIVATPA